jgi:hypothetical protein
MANSKQNRRDLSISYWGEIFTTIIFAFVLFILFNRIVYVQNIADTTPTTFWEAMNLDMTLNFWSFYFWFFIALVIWANYKAWCIYRSIKKENKTYDLLMQQNSNLSELCVKIDSIVENNIRNEDIGKLCNKIDSLIEVIRKDKENGIYCSLLTDKLQDV